MTIQTVKAQHIYQVTTHQESQNGPKTSKIDSDSAQEPQEAKDTLEIKTGLAPSLKGAIAGLTLAGLGTAAATTAASFAMNSGSRAIFAKAALAGLGAAWPAAVTGAIAGAIITNSTDNLAFGTVGGIMAGAIAGAGMGMPGAIGGAIGGGLGGLTAAALAEREN